jgi:alpha-1,3-mannosyltransferase
MKILHVTNHFYPCVGGVEKYVYNLCKKLQLLGHQSDVCCLDTCAHKRKKLVKYEEHEGIKIYRISSFDLKYYKIAPKVINYIKNYDIIHIHGVGFFVDFLSLLKIVHRKSLLLSTHGGIFHTKKVSFFKKIYFYFWLKHILKKINKTLAVSKNDYKLFSRISSNILLVENGVDFKYFSVKGGGKGGSMLYIGRISENKRIDNLIKVIYFLSKKNLDIKLYIVGEDWGGLKKGLEKNVRKNGLEKNVVFTGKVSDEKLLFYMKKARFFVSASEYEGFGLSVLEAMSSGTIPIINNIESFKNFIKNGKNGFIVDFSKPKKVAKIINNLINKDTSGISEKAKETAKKYDLERKIEKIEKIYKTLVRIEKIR